ncbi:unnamed protein product [Protopolystoma xenopodis]|uniref:Uncharacterized protein n=1 Tax=Protopolystoma xenopodis TaxID=117903 RepID=A0A3S5CNQ4_9PLAT|nr:unnamed protein product [Protopolystoma xenopodis]
MCGGRPSSREMSTGTPHGQPPPTSQASLPRPPSSSGNLSGLVLPPGPGLAGAGDTLMSGPGVILGVAGPGNSVGCRSTTPGSRPSSQSALDDPTQGL